MPRLGQHFLKNPSIAEEIVRAGRIRPGDLVLEIGPGRGVLTRALLDAGARVVAVEKDETLARFLANAFASAVAEKRLAVVTGDILNFDTLPLAKKTSTYKLIANIPYYITGKIIRKFLESEHQPSKMILLVQKEVAERIIAKKGKESILSLSIKAFGTPRYIKTIKRGSFHPPPKVESAILAIENITKDFFRDIDKEIFFSLVRKGFSQKRKKLLGNLSSKETKEILGGKFSACGIDSSSRAEDLSLKNWECITRASSTLVST